MALVTTSWTTTRVAPTRSAPFAEVTPGATPPASNIVGGVALILLGAGLLWFFLNPPEGYRWP